MALSPVQSWLSLAKNATQGTHIFILENGPNIPRQPLPIFPWGGRKGHNGFEDDHGNIFEGMCVQGRALIEQSKIQGSSCGLLTASVRKPILAKRNPTDSGDHSSLVIL
jgi:hypothetical protein